MSRPPLCDQRARAARSPAGDRREVLHDPQRSSLWTPHPPLLSRYPAQEPSPRHSLSRFQIRWCPSGLFWLYVTEVRLKTVSAKRWVFTGGM